MRLDFPLPWSFFFCTGLHLWNRNIQGGWDWWPMKHWDVGKKIYRTVRQLYEVKQHNQRSGVERNTVPDTKRKLCEKNLVSCSPRIQNGLYICCLHGLCCVSLALAAKKWLCICSRGWIPPENTDPALADAAQPEGNQPSAPVQMLALGLSIQQFRRTVQCPLCPVCWRFQHIPIFWVELPVSPSLTSLLCSYWLRYVQEPALRQMNSSFWIFNGTSFSRAYTNIT